MWGHSKNQRAPPFAAPGLSSSSHGFCFPGGLGEEVKWSHFDSAKLVITKARLPAKLNNVKGHWPEKIKKE